VSRTPDWIARRVHHSDAARLADLVGDPARFVADDLSQRVSLFTTAIDPVRLVDPDELWDDALTRGLRAPGFRLVRDGDTLPRASVTRAAGIGNETVSDVIQPNKVLELFDSGASVVLQGLHFTNPALARLATNLALDLDQPVQINAYLSPVSTRGLDLHFDFHDVLVVQLSGSKRWRVWDRLERTATPVRGAPETHAPTLDEVGEARFERVLEAGDCLHVPRGCPHSPETVDEASAHLTIGIMSFTRHRLVEQALTRAVGEPATSTLVPPGGLGGVGKGGESQLSAAATGAESALGLLATRLAGPALRRQLAIEVWRRQPVTRLRARVPVEARGDALLAVTPGPLVWAEHEIDDVVLGLGDRQLRMPIEAWPLLHRVLDAGCGSFTIDGIARSLRRQLDAESVRTVVERLIAEGVVAHATV